MYWVVDVPGIGKMKSIQIPGDLKALVDELRDVRSRLKDDRKREDEITTLLKNHTEQQPAMLRFNRDIVAMIEEKSSRRIDTERLRALHPAVADECSVVSTYLQVKVC
jgi:predicted phage-related endonuclease